MWFKINRNQLTNISNKDFIFSIQNKIRGGISSVMGDRYVKSDGNKKSINCRS